MRPYIQLTMLQGSFIPEEESLTEEAKAERKIQRIINGEDEDNHGLQVFTYGNFKEYPLYIPIDALGAIYGTEQGAIVETESGNFLVKEEPNNIMEMLIDVKVVDIVVRDGEADNQ